MNVFTINSQPFYDEFNQCYKNALSVNVEPNGPLRLFIRNRKIPRLSPFQTETACNPIEKCGIFIASMKMRNCCDLMTPDEIPDLMTFLMQNGYQVETQITNMLNQSEIKLSNKKIAFMVTYYGQRQPNVTYMR